MSAGRADEHDTAAGSEARRQRRLRAVGVASGGLGLVLLVKDVWTHPPVGSLGYVPEAVAALQAIGLGLTAILLARPVAERPYGRATAPVLLAAMVIATSATAILAIDGFGLIAVDAGGPARPLAIVGASISALTVTGAFVWAVTMILAIGADRLIRTLRRRGR